MIAVRMKTDYTWVRMHPAVPTSGADRRPKPAGRVQRTAWRLAQVLRPRSMSKLTMRYRGALSQGNGSRMRCAVHAAVGSCVTAKCTMRRRACANTKNTYRT